MAFPTKLLNDGEEVEIDLHPHWSTLVRPVGLLAVVLVATIAGVVVNHWLGVALAVVLLVTAVWAAIRVIRRQTTEFVVTNQRLVYRAGIVSKKGKEIPLRHINDISFHQSAWERLIGTGDLGIESAGAQSRETFGDIAKPSQVQNQIYRLIEQVTVPAPATAAPAPTVADQISQLDELRQRGVLTEEEFQAKKKQLLDRM